MQKCAKLFCDNWAEGTLSFCSRHKTEYSAIREQALNLLPKEALIYLLKGSFIYAIKEVRKHYNCGLKDAKDLVDIARNTSAEPTQSIIPCPNCNGKGTIMEEVKIPECFLVKPYDEGYDEYRDKD